MSEADGVPVTVTGGAGGIAASYDDLATLGALYELLGSELVEAAWRDRLEAADGDLVLSAVLSPATFGAAEAAILAATYGPHGLVAEAVVVEAQSFAFGAVVDLYRTADALQRTAYESLSYGLGFTVGVQAVPVALTGALALLVVRRSSPGLADRLEGDAVSFLEAHPEVVQTLANGSGGLLDGLGANPVTGPVLQTLGIEGLHLTTASAADDVGDLLFSDRSAVAVASDVPRSYAAPEGVEDLVRDLATTAGGGDGAITVQRVDGPDGTPRWIVHLPGTDAFGDDHAVRNMGSNLDLIAGDDTAYGEAVQHALRLSGVGADDPVLMVGHSQGGLQAAALAADCGPGRVTHVVTAGAPVATSDLPAGVRVLSLENSADLVPTLDGEPNRDRASHTTVVADVRTGDLGAGDGNHGLGLYASVAASADRSAHASVTAAISDMRDAGFLGAADGETRGFHVEFAEPTSDANIGERSEQFQNAA